MPRPKRPKIVHTVPTLRGARPIATSSPQKPLTNVSPASSGRVTNATDDSDGLVTTQRTKADARRVVAREKYIMTGALGEEETSGTRLRPPSTRIVEEVTRIAREAEYASIAADKRKAREIAAGISSDQIQIPSTLQPEAGTRPPSRARPSAVQNRRPSIFLRGQQTPLAHSSTLGAAMFKKRPRQPSLLQMAQSQNVQSELDDDDNDLYDFRPDDESTPLVKSLTRSHAQETSSSRQTSSSRKRKLTSPDIQVPASQPENMPSSPSADFSQPLAQEDASDIEESEAPEPVLPQPHATQTTAPEIFSDTIAPPQSSSSSPPPTRTKRMTIRKASAQPMPKSRTNKRDHPQNLPSTRSPNPTTSSTISPVRQALKPITTASLQNLLPRRRTRHRPQKGAYDFPSSSDVELDTTNLGEDEDELSFHGASKLRRKTKTPARNMQPSKKRGAKAKPKETSAVSEKGKRVSKTYTRKSLMGSDIGSGDEDEDDSLGPVKLNGKGKGKGEGGYDERAKKEMERLARKFAEVDEYTMDFEDMTGSSSQMADAR